MIEYHVPCHYDFMFLDRSDHARLRARGVRGALPPGRGFGGPSRGFGGGTPPNVQSDNCNFSSPEGLSDLVLAWNGKSENLNSSITKS